MDSTQQSLVSFGDMTIADVVRRSGKGSDRSTMAVQVAAFTQFVANNVAGGQLNVQLSRHMAIEFNRQASRNNRPGVEVPFLDVTLPSSKNLPALTSAESVNQLNLADARALAVGHGFGQMQRTSLGVIRERLERELGLIAP